MKPALDLCQPPSSPVIGRIKSLDCSPPPEHRVTQDQPAPVCVSCLLLIPSKQPYGLATYCHDGLLTLPSPPALIPCTGSSRSSASNESPDPVYMCRRMERISRVSLPRFSSSPLRMRRGCLDRASGRGQDLLPWYVRWLTVGRLAVTLLPHRNFRKGVRTRLPTDLDDLDRPVI
jgi:hypothetical protein